MCPVYIKEKVSIVPVHKPFQYNVLLYFLKSTERGSVKNHD